LHLVESTSIKYGQINNLVNHADLLRVRGIGEGYAGLLQKAGINSLNELAQTKPNQLNPRIMEINRRENLVRQLPGPSRVNKWVERAQKLPPAVEQPTNINNLMEALREPVRLETLKPGGRSTRGEFKIRYGESTLKGYFAKRNMVEIKDYSKARPPFNKAWRFPVQPIRELPRSKQENSLGEGEPEVDKHKQFVTRFTDISYPRRVWIETPRVTIVVRLTIKPSELSSIVEEMKLAKDLPVRIKLQSLAFQITNEIEQEILLPPDKDSNPVVFYLKPLEVGEHLVSLDFFQAGDPVGTISLPIEITSQEIATSEGKTKSQAFRYHQEVFPPERMLFISYERSFGQPTLSFTLIPSGQVGQSFRSQVLEADLADYANMLYNDLSSLNKKIDPTALEYGFQRALPVEDVDRHIRNFGFNLWKKLIPDELKEIYKGGRHEWKDQTLLIVSDEPYIPWEIIWPYGEDWQDDGPWCETTLFSRWLKRDDQGNGHLGPESLLKFSSLACLIPTDSGLPSADDEHNFLKELCASKHMQDLSPMPPVWSEVQDLLDAGGYDFLHAAAHGNFYPQYSDSDSVIWLQDGRALTPDNFVGPYIEKHIRNNRPSFVFNACHSGRQDWTITRLGGWANRLISIGAGMFLAPLWTVTDSLANSFVQSFYTELVEGKTVSEAIRDARKGIKEKGDPTWLAYSLYAHPNAKVALG
jgi:hypothetical protein